MRERERCNTRCKLQRCMVSLTCFLWSSTLNAHDACRSCMASFSFMCFACCISSYTVLSASASVFLVSMPVCMPCCHELQQQPCVLLFTKSCFCSITHPVHHVGRQMCAALLCLSNSECQQLKRRTFSCTASDMKYM